MINSVETYKAEIYIGFREQYTDKYHTYEELVDICKEYCDEVGLCVSIDRVDLPHIRERASWTGNGLDPQDVIRAIEYILDSQANTCIEEITAWVNYNFEQ